MKISRLASHVSQHPTTSPVNEIAVWGWIAGAILVVIVIGTALLPHPTTLASSSIPPTTLMAPPATQPLLPTQIISNPDL
jgi:hypothetical protein